MKISFLSLGDERAASSRIRVYTLQKALRERGVDACIGYQADTDVLVVQKKVDKEVIKLAARAGKEGKLVIYDVDDFGADLDYCCTTRNLKKILKIADLVTSDTRGHLEYLAAHYAHPNLAIVPDAIDYFPKGCATLAQETGEPLRILWFGGIANIGLFEKYALGLSQIPNTQIVVATAPNADLRARYPGIEFLPWSLSGFISILQGCHLTCLMHDGSALDEAKSNNKMITSICWGVPALVSRTPEYERTAREAGVGYAVFGDVQELTALVQLLRPAEKRAQYLRCAQEAVWSRYSPASVAATFLELVEKRVTGRRNKPGRVLSSIREKLGFIKR